MAPTRSSRRKARSTAPISGLARIEEARATAASVVPAGVREVCEERRRASALRLFPTLLAAASLSFTGGCGDDRDVPATLMDGSQVSPPSVELQEVAGSPVMTKVAV